VTSSDAVRFRVLRRDNFRCVDCGAYPCSTVHHIISRRYKGAWDEKNMVTLCQRCHLEGPGRSGAHSHEARRRHLEYLERRFGYVYSGGPWLEALERAS